MPEIPLRSRIFFSPQCCLGAVLNATGVHYRDLQTAWLNSMKAMALRSTVLLHCWRIQLTLEGSPLLTRYCSLLTSLISYFHHTTQPPCYKIALLHPSTTCCSSSRFLAHLCQCSMCPACPLLFQMQVPHKALLITSLLHVRQLLPFTSSGVGLSLLLHLHHA